MTSNFDSDSDSDRKKRDRMTFKKLNHLKNTLELCEFPSPPSGYDWSHFFTEFNSELKTFDNTADYPSQSNIYVKITVLLAPTRSLAKFGCDFTSIEIINKDKEHKNLYYKF